MRLSRQARFALNWLAVGIDQAAHDDVHPGGVRLVNDVGDQWLMSRSDLGDFVRRCFRVAVTELTRDQRPPAFAQAKIRKKAPATTTGSGPSVRTGGTWSPSHRRSHGR